MLEYIKKYLGQIFFFLFLCSITADLIDTEIGMGTIAQTYSSGSSGYLFHDDAVVQVTSITATIF